MKPYIISMRLLASIGEDDSCKQIALRGVQYFPDNAQFLSATKSSYVSLEQNLGCKSPPNKRVTSSLPCIPTPPKPPRHLSVSPRLQRVNVSKPKRQTLSDSGLEAKIAAHLAENGDTRMLEMQHRLSKPKRKIGERKRKLRNQVRAQPRKNNSVDEFLDGKYRSSNRKRSRSGMYRKHSLEGISYKVEANEGSIDVDSHETEILNTGGKYNTTIDGSFGLPSKAVVSSSFGNGGAPEELPKTALSGKFLTSLQQRLRARTLTFYRQLTKGCEDPNCKNDNCATSTKRFLSRPAALKRALLLVKAMVSSCCERLKPFFPPSRFRQVPSL